MSFLRTRSLPASTFLLALGLAQEASADCNVVPGTINAYPGNQGSSNTPFASPGDEVAIAVDTFDALRCESGVPQGTPAQSAGLPESELDTLVTVVFAPPDGPERAVVLSERACSDVAVAAAVSQCAAQLGGAANVLCAGSEDLVLEGGVPLLEPPKRLRFRFPDSHALLEPGDPNPLHTLAGPARIAVTELGEALPCAALAAGGCSAATGTRACVGELYEVDGTCERGSEHRDSSFSHFTALPIPTNYQALCETPGTPCIDRPLELPGQPDQIRFTVDTDGNVLWPVNWEGVLVGGAVPIPRLVQGSIELAAKAGDPDPMSIPKFGFLSAYSLQGHRLPPVFAPLGNPDAAGSVFGTADSPRGVLRIARRSSSFEQCDGGDRDGLPCSEDVDCPNGGSCAATTCQGGVNEDKLCASDLQCPGSECGPSLYEFRDRNDGLLASLETAGLGLVAESDFTLDARNPVPLDGLVETPDLLLEVRSEPSESANAGTPIDLNADGDADDVAVVTMRDRVTGATQSIGASGSPGRAVPRVRQSVHSFPAAAAEGDVIAFLEAEQLQGTSASCLVPPLGPGCDKNGDADSADTLLRVYRLGQGVVAGDPAAAPSAQITADPAPLVGGRSVAVSRGQVFFRASETAATPRIETPILNQNPGEGHFVTLRDMTEDGRFLLIVSDLHPQSGGPGGGAYVFDRDPDEDGEYDETSQLSACCGDAWDITPNGRFVVFNAPGFLGDPDVVIRDQTTGQTVDPIGLNGHLVSKQALSDDGRFVAASQFISEGFGLVRLYDRDVDEDGIFDEPGAVQSIVPPSPGGMGSSGTPSISGDGRWLAFDSTLVWTFPLDVVTTDTATRDVIVMDVATFTPRRMSVSTQGVPGSSHSTLTAISPDGRFVSFTSGSINLGGSPIPKQVYVRDRDPDEDGVYDEPGAVTFQVPPRSNGTTEGGVTSPDGRYVPHGWGSFNGVYGTPFGTFDQVTGLHDSASLSDWWTPRVSEGGRFVAGGGYTVRVRGIDTSPAAIAAADRNGDGDVFDTLLGMIDTSEPAPALHWLGASRQVELADGNAVFLLPEAEDPAGPDLNQDGDRDDLFVRLYRKGEGVVDLQRAARRVAISKRWIASIGWRPNQGVPANEGESTVGVHRVDGSSGWVDLDLPADEVAAAGDWIAFRVPEAKLGVHLNSDSDTADHVLHLYNASTGGAVVSTELAAEEFVLGERILAFRVSEAAQNAVLNGDGDQLDAVLFVVDLSDPDGAPFNTMQAALACPFEACDGRQPYRIAGETVTFLTREEDQSGAATAPGCDEVDPSGPGDCDLNGDGDASDILLQHFNAVSMALQSSPGVATSQFAAAPAGVCTDTGESCVSTGNCAAGECIVPPGRCELFVGGDCNVDSNPSDCDTDEFCKPFPGSSAGTCYALQGLCGSEADCPGTFSVCRNVGQNAQRLESPLDPYADGRQGLVSGGVCVETLAASCSDDEDCAAPAFCDGGSCKLQGEPCVTAVDCPTHATCVQNLVLAGDSDADSDFVAASIDNCPKHPNTDQSDVDSDRIGDRCDLQTCGDGVQQFAEQCDDGNTVAGDECDNACHLVLGPGGCAVGQLMLEAACSNGADDDGDGLVDHPEDGGCDGVCDTSERRDVSDAGPPRACDDGKDNDGDQLVDWPTDPGCLSPDSLLENPACSNGIDDDGDGVLDAIDGGCGDPSDRSEGPDCSDGIDNDGDGQTDHPADTHCASPAGASEAPFCSDGLDNDGDGALDFPADPGCTSALDDDERGPTLACDDGVDGDADGAADFPHDPGCASLTDPTETDAALVCDNGLDDDGDGAIDFPADPGCASWTDPDERLATAQCDDGLDHDGDALVDTDDPDCLGPDDPTEFHLSPNDLLVTDNTGTGKVIRVNPVSGAQTLVWESSDFFNVQDLAIDSNGDVYIVEGERNAVLRLDLEAGTQEVVSLGGYLSAPLSIDAEPRGTLVVTDQSGDRVLRIDPRTGAQQILYAGLPLEAPSGISVEADGRIIVSDTGPDALFRLDPTTGAISTLVDPGASWSAPRMIDVEPDGNILVVDQAPTDEIYRVTPAGALTLLSSGAPYNDTRGVVRSGNTIFITDPGASALFEFPSTGGVATALSSGGLFGAPRGIEAVPLTQCNDGVDQDGDALVDLADPDCERALDDAEWHLSGGDLILTDQSSFGGVSALFRIVADGSHVTELDRGTTGNDYYAPALGLDGELYVSDPTINVVYRIDPETGGRTVVASGSMMIDTRPIVVHPSGDLYVANNDVHGVVRIRTATGNGEKEIVTTRFNIDSPDGMTISADGNTLYLAEGASTQDLLFEVDLTNPGNHSVNSRAIVNFDLQIAPEPNPLGVGLDGNGNVLMTETTTSQIYRATLPIPGAAVAPGPGLLSGGVVTTPVDVLEEPDGDWIIVQSGGGLYRKPSGSSVPQLFVSDARFAVPNRLIRVPEACRNGKDDDLDGFVDHPADPGCASAADTSETDPVVACDDGLDNDLDLFVDFPADPGCPSSTGTSEDAECSNGEDDDGDGETDYPADAGCASVSDPSEVDAAATCDNGVDDDGDGLTDYPADPGCTGAGDASEQNPAAECDDGADDDGDGLADFPADPGCGAPADASERGVLDCDDGADDDGDGVADYPADPGCTSPSDTSERQAGGPACDDGADNDGDGLADEPADPGCTGPADMAEKEAGLACDDGFDNDSDGYTDYPADPACMNVTFTRENAQCQDGLNNDNQFGIDYDGGASRNGGVPLGPADPLCVGKPWQNYEKVGCGLGFEVAPLLAFLLARRRRRAG